MCTRRACPECGDDSVQTNPLGHIFRSYRPTYLPHQAISKSGVDVNFDLKLLVNRYEALRQGDSSSMPALEKTHKR